MKIISSNVFFLKHILPLLCVLIFVLGAVHLTTSDHASRIAGFPFIPLLILFSTYWSMRKTADEVVDYGDYLLVKKGRENQQIYLSDIMNVNVTTWINPPRIELRLRTASTFGDSIVFSPQRDCWHFSLFPKNAIAEDLIQRVDQARFSRRS